MRIAFGRASFGPASSPAIGGLTTGPSTRGAAPRADRIKTSFGSGHSSRRRADRCGRTRHCGL
jgi:hypothetical protein